MSATCPHCGGAIDLVPGANPAQPPGANPAQVAAQVGANGGIARKVQGSESPKTKSYNQGYEQDFLAFWSVYPLHRSKRKAQIAWRKSVSRAGANRADAVAQILSGAIRYRDDPNRDPSFTKYAEGWLNGDGWEDEPLPPRGQGRLMTVRPDPPRPLIGAEGMDEWRRARGEP
jgi:hypothetical protein